MRQIIAMGGGGFSMEPLNPLLDLYILRQARSNKPKVCFLPTASGDADNYIERFYESFNKHECLPTHLSLFNPPTQDLESFVMEQDILYVGGGNTRNLLVLWREWQLDSYVERALDSGIVCAGLSAGSLCWYEEGVTDSYGRVTPLGKIEGLGFLPGSHCPHYDGETNRRPAYHALIRSGALLDGVAADDGVALHYKDSRLHQVVSSRPNGRAFHVRLANGEVHEEEILPVYLGDLA